ncbi:MAG: hypothetical protein AAF468_05340 [Pseudomonadota bacterium]
MSSKIQKSLAITVIAIATVGAVKTSNAAVRYWGSKSASFQGA